MSPTCKNTCSNTVSSKGLQLTELHTKLALQWSKPLCPSRSRHLINHCTYLYTQITGMSTVTPNVHKIFTYVFCSYNVYFYINVKRYFSYGSCWGFKTERLQFSLHLQTSHDVFLLNYTFTFIQIKLY